MTIHSIQSIATAISSKVRVRNPNLTWLQSVAVSLPARFGGGCTRARQLQKKQSMFTGNLTRRDHFQPPLVLLCVLIHRKPRRLLSG